MTADEYETQQQALKRGSSVDDYRDQILYWLRAYPTLSSAQVCDWLKEHYNEDFRERTVSRYVKRLREEYGLKKVPIPRDYEAVPELPMGQQMQVDFGQLLMPNVDGGQTRVYAAAFLLSASRYKYAEMQSRPFTAADLVNICHNCFRYFGGIAYAGWRERADRPAWCTQTGQMVHGGRSRGAHDRHAGLLYSVIPLRLRMESPSTRIE